jgi:hypothetical protein
MKRLAQSSLMFDTHSLSKPALDLAFDLALVGPSIVSERRREALSAFYSRSGSPRRAGAGCDPKEAGAIFVTAV